MKRLLILVPFMFQIQGCNDANATSPPPVDPVIEYEVLHEAQYNEYANTTNKSVIIIKSQAEYENELLKRTSENIKTVNFEEETIILIDMGARNTGGHTINFESLFDGPEHIRAVVLLTLPGDNCVTTQAITNPFKLIKFKSTKEVLVTEELNISRC